VDQDFVHQYSDLVVESESNVNSSDDSDRDSEEGDSDNDDESESSSDDESDLTDLDDLGISNLQAVFIYCSPADVIAECLHPRKRRRRGHALPSLF
jgi:hypothetical protein